MIRVLLAEDQHVIRRALVALIGLEDDMAVVADVDRGDAVVPTARACAPDVAVLDIDLPGLDGLSAAEALLQEIPDCAVLVLTGLAQPHHLLRALQLSVRGFLAKDAPAGDLVGAIRTIAVGQRVLDPDMVAAALETGASPLTPRETDVLRTAATGISTTEIASVLFLSPATVRNYLSAAISKLGARNRLEALRIAQRAGWL
jgi:two-component system response regulator DesR